MTQASGVVRVCRDEGRVTFQVEGQGTMKQSPALRQFAEACLASGTNVCSIDLRRCTYLDSTFVGTLLCLKRKLADLPDGCLKLVSPSPECCQVFRQLRLERILPTVAEEEPTSNAWQELTGETCDLAAFQRTVVTAHQELAAIPGPAGDPFRELAGRMCQEIGMAPAKKTD